MQMVKTADGYSLDLGGAAWYEIVEVSDEPLRFYTGRELAEEMRNLPPSEGDPGWYESLSGEDRKLVDRLNRYNRNHRSRRTAYSLGWPYLVQAEPRLADLERYLADVDDSGDRFCANARWFGYGSYPSIKNALCQLVGWTAENPALKTKAAYDLAYEYLYELLPYCRNCLCPGPM